MTWVVVAAIAIAVVAGVAQTVTGFGYALVSVPLLALATDPSTAVFATVVVSALLSTFMVVRERHLVAKAPAVRLTLSSLIGMPLGLVLAHHLDDNVLTMVIGIVLLLTLVVMVIGPKPPVHVTAQVGAGTLSGALLTSTGLSGPPVVLALEGARLDPRRFRATLQSVFCAQDLLAAAAFVALGRLNGTAMIVIVTSLASLPLGWFIGERIFDRLTQSQFLTGVRVLLVLTALSAILRPVLS